MKHINLDREPARIKQFVRALGADVEGAILELDGAPVVRVAPMGQQRAVDEKKLKAAILARRAASRELNEDWESVDRDAWDQIPRTDR